VLLSLGPLEPPAEVNIAFQLPLAGIAIKTVKARLVARPHTGAHFTWLGWMSCVKDHGMAAKIKVEGRGILGWSYHSISPVSALNARMLSLNNMGSGGWKLFKLPQERPRKYGRQGVKVLTQTWALLDYMCGNRLAAILPRGYILFDQW